MRMEELSESRYVKNTDSVEKYLLNVVQEYFKNNSNVASTTSREYIIKKAVARMKEEITFEGIGVLSVMLPDDEKPRTGAVTISLAELHGEPEISTKYSAFNVAFGNEQNTACEGNDPRLSDKRDPNPHMHEMSEVVGLEGIISTLIGRIERIGNFLHEHSNKSLLDSLIYTGGKTVIDLTILDTWEDDVKKLITDLESDIQKYRNDVDLKISKINTDISNIKTEIDKIKTFIVETNEKYYKMSQEYTNTKVTEAKTEIEKELESLATKAMLSEVLTIANNTYTLAGEMEVSLSSILTSNNVNVAIPLSDIIINELATREQQFKDCITEAIIEYSSNGKLVYSQLPYIIIKDNTVDGSLQVSDSYDTKQINITLLTKNAISDNLRDAVLTYRVYSKEPVII